MDESTLGHQEAWTRTPELQVVPTDLFVKDIKRPEPTAKYSITSITKGSWGQESLLCCVNLSQPLALALSGYSVGSGHKARNTTITYAIHTRGG